MMPGGSAQLMSLDTCAAERCPSMRPGNSHPSGAASDLAGDLGQDWEVAQLVDLAVYEEVGSVDAVGEVAGVDEADLAAA